MRGWPWLKIGIGVFVVLIIMSLVGNLGGSAREESYNEGFEAGVASVTPPPTPSPTPVPDWTPEPTPQVIVEEVEVPVEVASQVCKDALYKADEVIGGNAETILDILDAYLDYPDEDLAQFGRRVEDILTASSLDETSDAAWEEYQALADECLGLGGTSS